MTEQLIMTIETPYRQPLEVKGWQFGNPDIQSLAVMGALRGNEIQQMCICALLIQALKGLEETGDLATDCGVLVVPCANQFSMNVGRRFWAADNSDINRMFPGYELGETTQRIAARLFDALTGFQYGVHLPSTYISGDYPTHVRIMQTGYDHPEESEDFDLPFVVLRQPHPYDTTTLNYNWQIWDTQAVSLYTRATDEVDLAAARQATEAIIHFMGAKGMLKRTRPPRCKPETFREERLVNVLTTCGGLFLRSHNPEDRVEPGEVLATVVDPCSGETLENVRATVAGRIFFARRAQLICGHEVAFRILSDEKDEP